MGKGSRSAVLTDSATAHNGNLSLFLGRHHEYVSRIESIVLPRGLFVESSVCDRKEGMLLLPMVRNTMHN